MEAKSLREQQSMAVCGHAMSGLWLLLLLASLLGRTSAS
jgi:hypothetical protein